MIPGLAAAWNGRGHDRPLAVAAAGAGSYSFWKVGQYTRVRRHRGPAGGLCHFAGEHTSIDFQGYLNGAVETGQRAAAEVLADPLDVSGVSPDTSTQGHPGVSSCRARWGCR